MVAVALSHPGRLGSKNSGQTGENFCSSRSCAAEQGMRNLRDDGLEKVRQGLTSLDEVTRVTT